MRSFLKHGTVYACLLCCASGFTSINRLRSCDRLQTNSYFSKPWPKPKIKPTCLSLMGLPETADLMISGMDFKTTVLVALESNDVIRQSFNVATFGPQIFWLLLILLPNAKFTKDVMGDYKVIIFFALVHLCIVVLSASEPNGTAPITEFADVFDPAGDPQQAMVGMMRYPNFVSEEWSHVLTWDLLVGRWIWLDGLRRGVFTGHSVLFCNLIGPPGFLIHAATCYLTALVFIISGFPGIVDALRKLFEIPLRRKAPEVQTSVSGSIQAVL